MMSTLYVKSEWLQKVSQVWFELEVEELDYIADLCELSGQILDESFHVKAGKFPGSF